MVIANAASEAGSYMQDAVIAQLNKSAAGITKGQVLFLDSTDNTFKTAPTGGTSTRYAVAVESATASDIKVLAAVEGHAFVVADGAIGPHSPLKVSGTTAGQVVVSDAIAAVADISEICGYFAGKADNNERDGLALAAAADGDVVLMKIGGLAK